jgi:hypothetical protein
MVKWRYGEILNLEKNDSMTNDPMTQNNDLMTNNPMT